MKKVLLTAMVLLSGCAGQESYNLLDSMLRVAQKARNSGNHEVSVTFYNKALAIDNKNVTAYLGLAEVYIDMNLLDASSEYIKKAEEFGASVDKVSYLRGKICLLQGNIQAAKAQFSKSHSIDALNALGAVYDSMGEHEKAQSLYKQVISKDPNYIDAYNNMGLSLMLCEKYNGAIRYLENACTLPEANAAYRSNLALAYGLSGQMDKAKEVYARDFDGKELQDKLDYIEYLISSKQRQK